MKDSEILDEYIKLQFGNLRGIKKKYRESFKKEISETFGFAVYRLSTRMKLLGKAIIGKGK